MDKKIAKRFEYYGLGFPVILLNFPVKKYWGEEMPDVDYNHLKNAVIGMLASKSLPLTGNEIRFVRQYFDMTYTEFAKRIGQTRQAVTKWEEKGDDFASVTPSTELYIRLTILSLLHTNNKVFREIYNQLDSNEELKKKKHSQEPMPLSISLSDIEV